MIIQPVRNRTVLHQGIGSLLHPSKSQLAVAVCRQNLINCGSIIRSSGKTEADAANLRVILGTSLFQIDITADDEFCSRAADL